MSEQSFPYCTTMSISNPNVSLRIARLSLLFVAILYLLPTLATAQSVPEPRPDNGKMHVVDLVNNLEEDQLNAIEEDAEALIEVGGLDLKVHFVDIYKNFSVPFNQEFSKQAYLNDWANLHAGENTLLILVTNDRGAPWEDRLFMVPTQTALLEAPVTGFYDNLLPDYLLPRTKEFDIFVGITSVIDILFAANAVDVVTINNAEEIFAPGIIEDTYDVNYSTVNTEFFEVQKLKVEIFAPDATQPLYVKENLPLGENKAFSWNGKQNKGTDKDKFITHATGSPFKVVFTAAADEDYTRVVKVELEGEVNKIADEWNAYPRVAAFVYMAPAKKGVYGDVIGYLSGVPGYAGVYEQAREKITREYPAFDLLVQEQYGGSLFGYINDNVVSGTFLGNSFIAHKNWWKVLNEIEEYIQEQSGPTYFKNRQYGLASFAFRQLGEQYKVSPHSFAMAVDIDPTYNPQVTKVPLLYLSLITKHQFYKNPGTVEGMKAHNAKFLSLNLNTVAKVGTIATGFEKMIAYEANEANIYKWSDWPALFETLDGISRKLYTLSTEAQDLSNKRHFTKRPGVTYYFNEDDEARFYQGIPAELNEIKAQVNEMDFTMFNRMLDVWNNGYSAAFLGQEYFPTEKTGIASVLTEWKDGKQKLLTACQRVMNLTQTTSPPAGYGAYGVSDVPGFFDSYNVNTVNQHIAFFKGVYALTYGQNTAKTWNAFYNFINSSKSYLAGLGTRGFFRMSAEFCNFWFHDPFKPYIDWGGYWNSKKDWMHFELSSRRNRFDPDFEFDANLWNTSN